MHSPNMIKQVMSIYYMEVRSITEQEAHRQWLAHLSQIATVDIFPMLSLQLMKGSFEQFFVSKMKKLYTIVIFTI